MADTILGVLEQYWKNTSDRVLGQPALKITDTPLPSGGTFIQPGQDSFQDILIDKVLLKAFANVAGTLYLEESADNSSWTTTVTKSLSANVPVDTGWVFLSKRYWRARYVNGSTAQTTFVLYQTLGIGRQTDNVVLTGSNAPKSGQKNVQAAGTAEALGGNQEYKVLTIIAKHTNTGLIYVGDSLVNASNGAILPAGGIVTLEFVNTNEIYIDASVSGEGVSWLGVI